MQLKKKKKSSATFFPSNGGINTIDSSIAAMAKIVGVM